MIEITKDYVAEDGHSREGFKIWAMPLYVVEAMAGEDSTIPNEGPTVAFRLIDDDGERCYDGTLTDDPDCLNQQAALRFGETDVGATKIYVRRGARWVQEIS